MRAIGEEPDDIALVVDAIDDGPHHAERGSLAKSRGVELNESGSVEYEAVLVGYGITRYIGADDEVFATTEGLCALGDHAIGSDIEGGIGSPKRAEKAVVI